MIEWLKQFLDDPEYPNHRIDADDGPTRIEAARKDYVRLRSEVERLRGALRQVISEARPMGEERYARIARAALEDKP